MNLPDQLFNFLFIFPGYKITRCSSSLKQFYSSDPLFGINEPESLRTVLILTRISHRITQRGGGDAPFALRAAEDRAGLTRFIKTVNEIPAVVLDGTSRRPKEFNAVRTDVYAIAAVSW